MLRVAASFLLHGALGQAPGVPQGGARCSSDWECSLSGLCNASSVCECDAWATGASCDLLNLAPANPDAGLQVPGYFSWGGHTAEDEEGTFHLFASFMCRHATLGEWTTKSSIWRATSTSPEGPFSLADMVAQPWSHNAMLAKTAGDPSAPTFALYQIGDAVTPPSAWQPCYNASEATQAFAAGALAESDAAAADSAAVVGRGARGGGGGGSGVFVRSAPALTGPWTPNGTEVEFVFPPGGWSSSVNGGNPAPFFFENGTVLMYYSANPCPKGWGNISPGNNCIGVARGSSWKGPFTALPLPVTHPESEDAAVFRDARGHFHLLTNVNNDHTRCAQGVPCGGHAWSRDGLTFSNLTIGAFGPIFRLTNGTFWRMAYAERPQVLQGADGTPTALYLGVGRASYYDSATWAQLFCVRGQAGCGPTLAPPTPPAPVVQLQRGGGCLATEGSGTFPCPGGWANSCPVFLAPCTHPASRWVEVEHAAAAAAAALPGATTLFLRSELLQGVYLNVDCNSCGAHTVVKAINDSASATPLAYSPALGQLEVGGVCAGRGMCVGDGADGTPSPPCKGGEGVRADQLTLAACSDTSSQGWVRVVVG
jgi:hypothetical protein